MNSTVSSSFIQIVKTESSISNSSQEYEKEINQLKKTHNEQILKLCQELEKSSVLIHQLKLDIDSMRISLNQKEKQLNMKTNPTLSIQNLQRKNMKLIMENTKLKKELTESKLNSQTLFNEIQDARQYISNMIARLD